MENSGSETAWITTGEPDLTPLKVGPGDWVVIKPNLVKECKETDPNEWRCVITAPELIESVCEHVGRSLRGRGRVTICDAPQTDSSFEKIASRLGLYELAARCSQRHGVPVDVIDLRNEEWINEGGVIVARKKLSGDPEGSIAFNLATYSHFYGHRGEGRYYGADYDSLVVNSHHVGTTQEYLLCRTPIACDVFINMPKMKTHKKTGVTLSLKNLVGINADKNWLPHHTEGSPSTGGDEYPDLPFRRLLEQKCVKFARTLALRAPGIGPQIAKKLRRMGTLAFGDGTRTIRAGNWFGNDTTWRMVLDLNRCLLYGQVDGTISGSNRKRYYSVVDGRVGMDGTGPMQGDPVHTGVVILGTDPAVVDAVAATYMGFDWRRIPTIRNAFAQHHLPISSVDPDHIKVVLQDQAKPTTLTHLAQKSARSFRPHFGWRGAIELKKQP